MPDYKAPTREIQFVRDEVLNYGDHYAKLPGCEEVTPDLIDAITNEVFGILDSGATLKRFSIDPHGCHFVASFVRQIIFTTELIGKRLLDKCRLIGAGILHNERAQAFGTSKH